MPHLALETLPKEIYLLIGAVLGFLGAMITTLINRRTQLKLSRETHLHQYDIEALKAQAQATQEAQTYLRSKIEEAHQMLSKIAMENSQEACHIMLQQGVTVAEYHTQYQRQQVELQRLQMLVALYFPKLCEETDGLSGLTSQFWGKQKFLIAHKEGFETINDPRPLGEILEEDPHRTLGDLIELANEIQYRVRIAQNRLQSIAYNAIPPVLND